MYICVCVFVFVCIYSQNKYINCYGQRLNRYHLSEEIPWVQYATSSIVYLIVISIVSSMFFSPFTFLWILDNNYSGYTSK